VQFGARGNPPGELGFDVHVDVFEVRLPREFAGLDFAGDGFESAGDGAGFGGCQHADFAEHGGMGERAENIMPPEPAVKGDGLGESGDIRAGAAREPSAAGNGRVFFHALQRPECAPGGPKSHSQMPDCSLILKMGCLNPQPPNVHAMSEFKYACPVCGQHIKCDTTQAGTTMECPTCFQKIIVPQAPPRTTRNLFCTARKSGLSGPSRGGGQCQTIASARAGKELPHAGHSRGDFDPAGGGSGGNISWQIFQDCRRA